MTYKYDSTATLYNQQQLSKNNHVSTTWRTQL